MPQKGANLQSTDLYSAAVVTQPSLNQRILNVRIFCNKSMHFEKKIKFFQLKMSFKMK